MKFSIFATEKYLYILHGHVFVMCTGSYNGWTEDFERSGGPFCVNVSLIQTLYKLFGDDIKATGGSLDRNEKGFTAVAKLSTEKCRFVVIFFM